MTRSLPSLLARAHTLAAAVIAAAPLIAPGTLRAAPPPAVPAHVPLQGASAEWTLLAALVLPGGDHGDFEFILDADGRNGAIVFADGTLGVFDFGDDFYAATGQRGIATLLYGTLRTRVVIPRLELLAYRPTPTDPPLPTDEERA
ncbi:MAG: hypothetical protein HY332_03635 [Chloroflexi bacterium]|nr:hypothetical protein [Chloroflexota bacterium]